MTENFIKNTAQDIVRFPEVVEALKEFCDVFKEEDLFCRPRRLLEWATPEYYEKERELWQIGFNYELDFIKDFISSIHWVTYGRDCQEVYKESKTLFFSIFQEVTDLIEWKHDGENI